ncbi:MAG: glutamine-hydrolyzing GMP synthase, partial [Terrimicrobiaceae bacterium]|nr:glutamine-hydrolyzing GMP synthase [Terrimicrobiaceae bacterium]
MTARSPSAEKILIFDFGSQYTQVIARRVRELRVYSEIVPYWTKAAAVRELAPSGIIFSGGPASVYARKAPRVDTAIYSLGVPILGICYGMQLLAKDLGGHVERSERREYGAGRLEILNSSGLFEGLSGELDVWNSHGDRITRLPPGFQVLGRTENSPHAVIGDPQRKIFGLQFHPEVAHTPRGKKILGNFLHGLCGCRAGWTMGSFIERTCAEVRERVGDARVLLGLSGGVDSSVAAALLHEALGSRLTCLFVDNGLLRAGEAQSQLGLLALGFRCFVGTI